MHLIKGIRLIEHTLEFLGPNFLLNIALDGGDETPNAANPETSRAGDLGEPLGSEDQQGDNTDKGKFPKANVKHMSELKSTHGVVFAPLDTLAAL